MECSEPASFSWRALSPLPHHGNSIPSKFSLSLASVVTGPQFQPQVEVLGQLLTMFPSLSAFVFLDIKNTKPKQGQKEKEEGKREEEEEENEKERDEETLLK